MSAPTVADRPILSVRDLALRRGGRTLFSGLCFDAGPGDAIVLRGPNGAGKTSLLLVVAGILRPDAGTVTYGGPDTDLARHIHLMLPLTGLKPALTVRENLEFWRTVNGADGTGSPAALARVGLGGVSDLPAGHLSTGQLRRLALARLLVSDRPVWLLDEPTTALDRQGHALVADLVQAHRETGGTALIATHDDLPLAGSVPVIDLGAST